jgi:hypothetical protein
MIFSVSIPCMRVANYFCQEFASFALDCLLIHLIINVNANLHSVGCSNINTSTWLRVVVVAFLKGYAWKLAQLAA